LEIACDRATPKMIAEKTKVVNSDSLLFEKVRDVESNKTD